MGDAVQVNASEVFQTAHTIGNYAEELRDELIRLVAGWDDLSHTWEGVAAKAYGPVFDNWHENAAKIVEHLAQSSQRLASAAIAYEEQDAESAEALGSTGSAAF